jgi:hypothetical protein
LNNVEINVSHDVTSCLIFGKEYEVFADYAEMPKNGKVFWEDREDIVFSKGASETTNPLPVISALAKNLINAYKEYPEAFAEENDPDNHIIPIILRKTMEDLNLDPSHIEEAAWICPTPITNGEYLFQNDLSKEEIIFPLTFELINLIGHSTFSYKGSRAWNSKFLDLANDYVDYALYLSEIKTPTFLMNQRIKQSTFKPVGVITTDMDETQYSFAVTSNAGILSLAWAELYFAQVYEMPFSMCTYCGQVYRLSKNLHKGTCDNISCRKSLRKDRDQQKRENDPENEREKDRLRQQRLRDKRKVRELVTNGKTAEEIQSYINNKAKQRGDSASIRTIDEIKKWIKN